jgi:hypothetical protein
MGGWFVYNVNIASNLTSNRPKSVLLGKVGAHLRLALKEKKLLKYKDIYSFTSTPDFSRALLMKRC